MVKIARRRRGTIRYIRSRAKRAYRRSGGGNSFKPFINGAIAGVASEAGQKFLGAYGVPLAVGAVGFFMKDPTLKTIAGLQAGSIIGDMLPFIGGNGRAIGGNAQVNI